MCPTFLDGFGARKCKSCSKTRVERPNAFWGSQNTRKRRTRMQKCGLGHLGAKRAPTAPLERLGAFGPLRTPINVGHVCKSAKVIFCNFIFIFQKIKSYKNSLLRFGIRVRRFLMFLEPQNAFGRSKRVLEQLLHFGAPKPSRNVGHV